MIARSNLPWSYPDRIRSLLFVVSCLLAIGFGFFFISPDRGGRLIIHGGYYYVLVVFALWLLVIGRVVWPERNACIGWLRGNVATVAFLISATAFAVWTDSFSHKLLFDDYVLQGSAWHMHVTKEVATPVRAYDFNGTWQAITTFLDKRPYFFPFLVSALHDLTGFRLENVFVVNVALSFVVLASVFTIVRLLTDRRGPALLAVALLATLPLFGQNATGASMEMLNLAMIAVLLMTAIFFLRRPDEDRLSVLVLGTILLAQTRYESVLFVLPAAAVIVFGWVRERRVFLSWPAMIAPLLLVPYAWHDRFVSSKEYLWQLRQGEESRFATKYLAGNLEGARAYFFSTSPEQSNSLYLWLLGLGGVGWAIVCLWRIRREWWHPRLRAALPVLLFGLTIVANLGLLMFYYWSKLNDPVAARFALPLFLVFSIVAGWLVSSLVGKGVPALRIATIGLALWLMVFAAPAFAHRLYTERNLVMHELDWEVEEIRRLQPSVFVITSKATLPYLLREIPALNTNIAPLRAEQIAWHMREGTFREVLVSQIIRPSSAQGEMVVDPEDQLPDSFKLETIAMKRFGARWSRISRVTSIDRESGAPQPPSALR